MFQLEFPDGWQLDLEFDPAREDADAVQPPRVVEATPTDGSKLWLGTWVVTEIDEIIKARTYFESLESFVFKDVMIERSRSEQHNNMPALILSGRAKKGSEAVQWAMVFFQPQENIVAAFLLIGVPEVRSRRKRELQAMIQSLRPVP